MKTHCPTDYYYASIHTQEKDGRMKKWSKAVFQTIWHGGTVHTRIVSYVVIV